jgi:hypothetical protein
MAGYGARGKDLRQGELITLFAAAARATAAANAVGTAVYLGGERRRFIFILNVTAAATDAADTLDVYVDWSLDGTTYFNGAHFTQVVGNGGAVAYYTVFDATTGLAADVAITADQAANTTSPALFGPYVRGRYTLVDSGDADQSFTFSLLGYAL